VALLGPTRFTDLVGCRLPVQQAGMGAVSTPALAAAVAGAGGLGMLGAAGLGPDAVVEEHRAAMAAAGEDARIGVNFLLPFLDPGAFEAAAATAPLVECFYGDPDPSLVERAGGALVAWQVGSVDEARAAVDAGCDLVVAQGVEAGGHVRGTTSLFELLPAVRAAVDVPVVAAGGLGTGAAIAAALDAGADAVRIGTVLLATPEADVHPAYAAALAAAVAGDTELVETFAMGWPGAPHRVLRSCVGAGDLDPSARSPLPPTRSFAGDVASAALYAGTSVDAVGAVRPAAEVIDELVRDAAAARSVTPPTP
jgi:NAD(P)H-dependent flavin oxidoreductase YrpB (nitropropane dioxygenase family)